MQYLVTGEFIDPGPLLFPDQLAAMIQQLIVPSHDALTYLKSEGKLIAGDVQSERGLGRLSLRQTPMQSSNAELDSLLQSLPYWGLIKINVTPLVGDRG
jgi:hypothetical protein